MGEFKFTSEYSIGAMVYHVTPESLQGVVVDISYSVLHRMVKYNVVFGIRPDDDVWCFEHELSTDKVF